MAASPKVLAPPPTQFGDLADVMSVMHRLQKVTNDTTFVVVESAVLRLKDYESNRIIGHITVSDDWESFAFTPGETL